MCLMGITAIMSLNDLNSDPALWSFGLSTIRRRERPLAPEREVFARNIGSLVRATTSVGRQVWRATLVNHLHISTLFQSNDFHENAHV